MEAKVLLKKIGLGEESFYDPRFNAGRKETRQTSLKREDVMKKFAGYNFSDDKNGHDANFLAALEEALNFDARKNDIWLFDASDAKFFVTYDSVVISSSDDNSDESEKFRIELKFHGGMVKLEISENNIPIAEYVLAD